MLHKIFFRKMLGKMIEEKRSERIMDDQFLNEEREN